MDCCICELNVKSSINIFTDRIGRPAILISDLVMLCTKGTNYELPENSTICKNCYEKLLCYYKSIQVAKQLRNDVLQLIPALGKEFNTKVSKKRKHTDDNDSSSSAQGYSALQQNVEEGLTTTEEQQMYVRRESLDIKPDLVIVAESNVPTTNEDSLEEKHDANGSNHVELVADDDKSSEHSERKAEPISGKKCPNCEEIFYDTQKYDEHVKRKHARYVCDQCGKTMLSYSGFIGHVQNHETVKQHECPECGERFNQKIRLNYHMTKHTGETPYECNICFKKFAHCNNLYKHKQIHNEESKRLECKYCDRKFRTKDHLTRHSRLHTGVKPYNCPICDKSFAQSYNVRLHMKIHEKKGPLS